MLVVGEGMNRAVETVRQSSRRATREMDGPVMSWKEIVGGVFAAIVVASAFTALALVVYYG